MANLTIPNSVTSIGDCAFTNCTGLAGVTIGNSVTSIGNRAFTSCVSLTSIIIPNSVTSIGNEVFAGCQNMASATIGNSVTSIGEYAFGGCSGLTSITVTSGNSTYDSRNNCNAIIETATNTLIIGCMNTTIPNSVTAIGDGSFDNCSGLTSIEIPNSVTSIGNMAFWGCSLDDIDIPNSVISIGKGAFAYSRRQSIVTIPNTVTLIGENAFKDTRYSAIVINGEGEWQGDSIDCNTNCLAIDSRITSVKGMKVNASDVYCYSTTPPICDENSFTNYSGTLHVPATSLSAYFIAEYWCNFANIVGDAVELTAINISKESTEVSIGTWFSFNGQ